MNRIFFKLTITAALTATMLCAQADTDKTSADSKGVTEIVINGQQNASDWFRAESTHFVVYSDTNRANVSKLLEKLERLDYLLQVYANNEKKSTAAPKLTLYYFKKFGDMRQLIPNQPEYAIGLYNSCAEGVQGFNAHLFFKDGNGSLLEKQQESEGLAYIFEAYARHFIYHNSNLRTPTWYIDGFAQYFASTRFSDTETVVGMAPQTIRDYLGSIHSTGRYDSLDYEDILRGNDSHGPSLSGKDGVRLEFEAKSWLLTHYILSSSDNIQRFRQYVNLIIAGVELNDAFEKAFGFKVKQLSKVLWRYKWQSAQALKSNFNASDMGEISFTDLPSSANNLLLADAALKACPDEKQTADILQRIEKEAKKFPNSDLAQLTLSRAQIQAGKPQEALTYLSAKTQTDKSNYDAFYLLGRAQTTLAETSQGEARKNYFAAAKTTLLRACSLGPQSPAAFYAYFKAGVNAQEKPSEDVLGSIVLASKLAREVSSYTKYAALTYAYLGQTQNAQDALATLASNEREPKAAEWAKHWSAKISSGVKAEDILAEMRAPDTDGNRFKEWTYANAEVMQAITLAANRANANNMILDQQDQGKQANQLNNSQNPNN